MIFFLYCTIYNTLTHVYIYIHNNTYIYVKNKKRNSIIIDAIDDAIFKTNKQNQH